MERALFAWKVAAFAAFAAFAAAGKLRKGATENKVRVERGEDGSRERGRELEGELKTS